MESIRLRILIVDDDIQLRDAIRAALNGRGFDVTTAASGEEALSIINKNKFDAIVSDFTMPNGDGLWLLEMVKKLGLTSPFILTTGSIHITEEHAKNAGAFGLLRKPVSASDYSAMIDAALR